MFRILTFVVLMLAAPALAAERLHSTSAGDVLVEPMLTGLDTPWAIAFLPGGEMLVTERDGRLLFFDENRQRSAVGGVPEVFARGQGGLLDVVAARDFARTREIFLTYAEPRRGGAGTALAVARLSDNGKVLENLRVIFRMTRASRSGIQFGSRVVEAADGSLFLTVGDHGDRDAAQDLNVFDGKVVRILRDGSPAPGNPYLGGGGLPEIWSLGHRNAQGAALDGDGVFYTVAHGPRGGDEVNRPEAGKNYGWPVISYGVHYSGARIGVGQAAPGLEQPLFYWDPSIAPSGLMIYSGKLWPEWRGDFFVGSLKFDFIARLERDGGRVREAEQLFEDGYIRIRDIREAPDGSIWFLAEGEGAAYRVVPANRN